MASVTHALGLVAGIILTLILAVPQNTRAQNIPPAGKPQVDGMWCPHCRFSFVHKSPSAPIQTKPQRQTINPFGNSLFYDVPMGPTDEKLKSTHLDPSGLAARAEDLAKEMQKVHEQTRKTQEEQLQSFEKEKQALLTNPPALPAQQQLLNIFASDSENDPNVVDLRDAKSLIPGLLRDAKPKQTSPLQDESAPTALSRMSDERLTKKRKALTKAIAAIQKLQSENVKGYIDLEADATAGKEAAWHAVKAAGTTVAFGTLQTITKTPTDLQAAETDPLGADGIDLATTLSDTVSGKASTGYAIAQIAPVASGLLVASPPPLSGASPIGALPGAIKIGFDTGLVWTDHLTQSQEYERQEALRKKHEASIMRLATEQERIIAEQNRRKQMQ